MFNSFFRFFWNFVVYLLVFFIHKRVDLDDKHKDIEFDICSIALDAKEHDISSKKHAHAKVTICRRFFNIITKVDSLKALVDLVPVDPSIPSTQTRRFICSLGAAGRKETCHAKSVQKYKRKMVLHDIPTSERGQFNL